MNRSLRIAVFAAACALAPVVYAQKADPYTARIALGADAYTYENASTPVRPRRVTPAANPVSPAPIDPTADRVLNFYGGEQARRTLAQMPTRATGTTSVGRPMVRNTKPFNTVVKTPTVSPYLNLYREDEGDAAPNYYAFVRPQQDQMEANARAAASLQRLQGQLRQAEGRPMGGNTVNSAASRYGDTGRYYGNWRR
jgi:hypothetical protein